MANLTNPRLVVNGTETATTAVTTDDTEGTLYAAARTSAPYQTGDEEAIKNGTGADWSDSIIGPTAGENTFSLTMLSDDTQYHCGFVHETPDAPLDLFEHDFNADLGLFTHERVGDAWGFKHNGYVAKVTTDKPVFFKTEHDGTDFTPHADYQGLALSDGSVNTMLYNGSADNEVRDNWNYLNATVGEDFQIGELWMTPVTGNSASPAGIARSQDGASYSGPWVWVCYVAEGTANGFSLEFDNARGGAHYAWVGGEPVLQVADDGAKSWAYHCGGGLWAIVLSTTGTTNQFKTLTFYPARKDAWVNGQTTYFVPGVLLDDAFNGNDVSPVSNAAVITNRSQAYLSYSDMGLTEEQDFTLFMRLTLFIDDTRDSAARTIATFATANATTLNDRVSLRLSGGKETCYPVSETKVGSDSTVFSSWNTGIIPGGEAVNLFIRYNTASTVITFQLNSEKKNSAAGAALVMNSPRQMLLLGSRHLTDTSAYAAPMAIRNLKLWNRALTDQEMDDINNAYP